MPVQTQSTRVKAPATSDPGNLPVEALSTNEKSILNLSERVNFDRPLEDDYYKMIIIKMIIIKY